MDDDHPLDTLLMLLLEAGQEAQALGLDDIDAHVARLLADVLRRRLGCEAGACTIAFPGSGERNIGFPESGNQPPASDANGQPQEFGRSEQAVFTTLQ